MVTGIFSNFFSVGMMIPHTIPSKARPRHNLHEKKHVSATVVRRCEMSPRTHMSLHSDRRVTFPSVSLSCEQAWVMETRLVKLFCPHPQCHLHIPTVDAMYWIELLGFMDAYRTCLLWAHIENQTRFIFLSFLNQFLPHEILSLYFDAFYFFIFSVPLYFETPSHALPCPSFFHCEISLSTNIIFSPHQACIRSLENEVVAKVIVPCGVEQVHRWGHPASYEFPVSKSAAFFWGGW